MFNFDQFTNSLSICFIGISIMMGTAQSIENNEVTDTFIEVPAIGKVVANNLVNITSLTEGRLVWLAEIGDKFKEGEVLAKLENSKLSIKLKILNTEKKKIEQRFFYIKKLVVKSRKLYKTNGVSLSDLDKLEHNEKLLSISLEEVNAKRELLLFNIDELAIKAPFNGLVTARFLSKGFFTLKGQPLITFVSQDEFKLDIMVSNKYITNVSRPIVINSQSRFGVISSTLKSIIPKIDPHNSMFHIRIKLPDHPWFVGETMRVKIQMPNSEKN